LTPTVSTTGTPNSLTELCGVDHDALAARDVRHVERDHHGQPKLFKLNTKRRFWRRLVASVTQTTKSGWVSPARRPRSTSCGDLFIGGQRIEAVGAGQIQNAHAQARRREQRAFLALDGDAGVIGDLLPAAGENVEKCRLAAVGISNQGDQGASEQRVQPPWNSRGQRLLRTYADTGGLEQPQRKCSGPDAHRNRARVAIKPRATIRSFSPGRKPNSAKRRPNSDGQWASGSARRPPAPRADRQIGQLHAGSNRISVGRSRCRV
jgi:hypothetical protein